MTLQISNISKRYGNSWVLRDASFRLEPGRITVLFGASDSGKTTLLRIIAGVEDPTPKKAKIGLSVRKTSIFPLSQDSFFSRLVGKQAKDPTNHHGDLLRALEGARDILLLDDPLKGSDILLKMKVVSKIRSSTFERQLAVLYATSDFETASLVGDELAVIESGGIGQIGSPEKIYEIPKTRFIASITGRCNIFEARRLTSSKTDTPEFQTINGEHRLFAEKADIAKLGSINRNVALAIRPENISISFGASFPEDNLLRAVVTRIQYLGQTTLIEFDCGGLQLEAAVFRLVGLNVGDECMLGLPPDRIRILKE